MKDLLNLIEETQESNINESASAICESIINGGVFHVMDTGHMLMYEGVGRSGGLMLVRPLRVSVEVDNPVRKRSRTTQKVAFMDEIEGLPDYILDKGNVEPGDVLMIGSVSGVKTLPVGLALAAKKRKVTTIAITSIAYSGSLRSMHPSEKKLFEITDYVLDNCSPEGDALVYVESLGLSICPGSGIGAAYVMWSLQSRIVEILLEKGINPSIYKSHYLDGASIHNRKSWERHESSGF